MTGNVGSNWPRPVSRHCGVAVCAVLHQPRLQVFELAHQLLLLGPSGRTVYMGPTVNPAWQDDLALAGGERRTGLDFWLPLDADRDRMGDAWERSHGLDPARDDSAEDPDGDTYDNLTEYHLGTDPMTSSTPAAGCRGCGEGGAAALLLLPLALRRRREKP